MDALTRELELPNLRGDDLVGTWHVVQTTFPMWRSGKNTHPTLNYRRITDSQLEDLVIYRKHGKPKQIRGVDRQDSKLPCHFTWRGRGLLALLKSEWYVVDFDRELIAIYFSKTLFTPAGLDIASRSASPDPAGVAACLARVRASAFLRPHADALVEIHHD